MTLAPFPRLDAVHVYLIASGVGAAALAMYAFIASVYRIVDVGLDPLQLVLVGTVLEIAVFALEVPTGVLADVYGRRLSIILGTLLMGAAFAVEGLVPLFWTVLFAQVVFGAGATLRSGAWQAWIADELDNRGVGRVYLRGSQVGKIGAVVGIGAGVAVSNGYVDLPIADLGAPLVLAGLVLLLLGLFMTAAMPEHGFRPAPGSVRVSWGAMADTFVRTVRLAWRRPELLAVLAIAGLYGASSEPFDRFWELHVLEVSDFALPAQPALGETAWWGIISVATLLLGIAGVELVTRHLDVDAPRAAVRVLAVTNALSAASIVGFALAGNFTLALCAYLVYKVVRGIGGPVKSAWTNQLLESDVRATAFSVSAQMDALGQVVSGPSLGVVAARVGVRAALLVSAALLAPPQAIITRAALPRTEADTDEDARG